MVEPRLSMTAESVAEVQRQAVEYGYAVFASIVSHSTKYSWSSRQTLPIFRSEPNSRYSSEIQILVNEFIERLEGSTEGLTWENDRTFSNSWLMSCPF